MSQPVCGVLVSPPGHAGRVSSFRFPDGVELLGGGNGEDAQLKVDIPLDDDGYFGRVCPDCGQHFRVAHEDYDALPDDLRLWCVYCGHHDDHSEFVTQQQLDRALRAVGDYGVQLLGRTLDQCFGRAAQQSSGFLTYRSEPFYPSPLPGIDEERLIRERRCASCEVRYAIFGEHRFCPVCGQLPPLVTAIDALEAEMVRLDMLADLEPTARATLREAGVLDRTYVDTIENVVGIVEALADRVFRSKVPDAGEVLKGKGKIFQRLDELADLFHAETSVDVRSTVSPVAWGHLLGAWAARHVFTHCDGMVDARYCTTVPHTSLKVGQRLRITETDCRSAIANAEVLCRALATIGE